MTAVAKRRKDGDLDGGRPSAWIAAGVLGSAIPPPELLETGRLRVGAAPDADVRVDVRWLDDRDLHDVLPPVGQRPVDPAAVGADAPADPDPLVALAPALASVGPVAPAPAPPLAHLSYSSLTRHARCGLRFHLERIAGLRERDRPVQGRSGDRLDARARGSIVHRVLELADLADPAGLGAEVLAAADELDVRLTEGEVVELVELMEGALRTPLMGRVRDARLARREASFTIPLAPGDPSVPVLLGIVDLVAEEAGGTTLVVDYKTDRVDPDVDLDAVVAAGYGVQRTIYALAALSAGARRVDVAHLYLERPDAPVVATFEAADADALRADLRGRAAGILAGDFPPTAEPDRRVCSGCPGRGGLCPVPYALTERAPEGERDADAASPPAASVVVPSRPAARPARRPPGQTTLF